MMMKYYGFWFYSYYFSGMDAVIETVTILTVLAIITAVAIPAIVSS